MSHIELRLRDALKRDQVSVVGVQLSTFDVPTNATADLDETSGLVTFRFKYIDDEPAGPSQRLSDDISIDVGKNSGKLLAVRVNFKRYKAGTMRVSFHKAIDEMDRAFAKTIREQRVFHRRKNYELVRSVIDENRTSVESALAG